MRSLRHPREAEARPLYDADSIENRDARAVERAIEVLEPLLERWFHPLVRGLSRIPDGPGLYVANHNGGVLMPDVFVLATALYRARDMEDLPYALCHELAVSTPWLNHTLVPLGAVRAKPENAAKLFAARRKVLVYPGGDLEVLRPYRDRNRIVFGARRGYVRLAIEHGVPIIPTVTAGAHEGFVVLTDGHKLAKALRIDKLLRVNVLPVTLSVPWGVSVGFPPPYIPLPTRIYTEILEPIRFPRTGPEAARDAAYVELCHRRVVSAMQAALDRLAAEREEDRAAGVAHWVRQHAERAMGTLDRWLDRGTPAPARVAGVRPGTHADPPRPISEPPPPPIAEPALPPRAPRRPAARRAPLHASLQPASVASRELAARS